jgi:capsular polysaccharide biosynthesis protein
MLSSILRNVVLFSVASSSIFFMSMLYTFVLAKPVYESNVVLETGQLVQFVKVEGIVDMRTIPLVGAPALGEIIRESYRRTDRYGSVSPQIFRDEQRYINISARAGSLAEAEALLQELVTEVQEAFKTRVENAKKALADQKVRSEKEIQEYNSYLQSSSKPSINLVIAKSQVDAMLAKINQALEVPLIANIQILNQFPTSERPVGPNKKVNLVFGFFLGVFFATVVCVLKEEVKEA